MTPTAWMPTCTGCAAAARAGGDMGIRTVYGVGYVCTTPVQIVGGVKNKA